ncbi:unnamed protein product [Porites evermanni]|uniref:Uncharacterized protein n=1 Tax=Porites evermanni TaxID=104178 RepID=A0ABN8M3Q5_9CNID|nr:unnamed protein product [Porites evermanni]
MAEWLTCLPDHRQSHVLLNVRPSPYAHTVECFLKDNEVGKQGNIPFNALFSDVLERKISNSAASAFTKSSLFGSQLWIYGTIIHFEKCSAEYLAGNELKWREVLCLATVVTIVEALFFGILCIRRILQSIGIPKRDRQEPRMQWWRLPLTSLCSDYGALFLIA